MKVCERCGVSSVAQAIHAHHVVGRVGKNKNDPANLINLCYICHMMWHEHRDQSYEEWMYRYMKSKHGLDFPIKVNGKPYNTKWIANVLAKEDA